MNMGTDKDFGREEYRVEEGKDALTDARAAVWLAQ